MKKNYISLGVLNEEKNQFRNYTKLEGSKKMVVDEKTINNQKLFYLRDQILIGNKTIDLVGLCDQFGNSIGFVWNSYFGYMHLEEGKKLNFLTLRAI